ncbi:MAG: hypothetical protein EKK53_10965 [Burkholderiales bacterium]|nr:MAG: hypothetical protein EKK53_10965 [Burkholderiales bacterium]
MPKIDYTRLLRQMIGYALVGLVCSLLFIFCVYVKSWWDEPLGLDGLALLFVLLIPVRRTFPIITKLLDGQRPGG